MVLIARQEAEKLGYLIMPLQSGISTAKRLRNQQMLDEGKPDLVVWFHYDLHYSKGTRDMVNRAISRGIRVQKGDLCWE